MGNIKCTSEKPSFRAKSKYGYVDIPMTVKDIQLLKETWPLVKENWLDICAIAFERWFTNYPELRYMFKKLPRPNESSMQEMLKCSSLKMHATNVGNIVELLLTKVDDAEDFVNSIIEFGERHYYYGAEQKYATYLAAAIQYGITIAVDCGTEVENAWDSLIRFVMDCLKLGMRKELEKLEVPKDSKTRERNINLNVSCPTESANHSDNQIELSNNCHPNLLQVKSYIKPE